MSATATHAAHRRIRSAGQDGYQQSPHRYNSPDLATQDGFVAAYALGLRDAKERLADSALGSVAGCLEFAAAEIDLLARESGIDLGDQT